MWGLAYEPWLIREKEVDRKISDRTEKPQEATGYGYWLKQQQYQQK